MLPGLPKLSVPLIQAPMAGTSTAALAAAVSDAGGLGSIAVGAMGVDAARRAIDEVRRATDRPFNVNVFCHAPATPDEAREAAWRTRLAPEFARYDAAPPAALREIYRSFLADAEMAELLRTARPAVVSFHFGIPDAPTIASLREAGIALIANATNLAEARRIEAAGIDAVIAQGWEAGGHRGVFDEHGPDSRLGTCALVRLLASRLSIPVIAAGGIMDGAGIAAARALGAAGAQLGTAFVACPESAADDAYRAALLSDAAEHTVMTRVISGRPARCLANRFTAWGEDVADDAVPAYPRAYDAGKALAAASRARGVHGYGAEWAGQGAPLARPMEAAELVAILRAELEHAGR